MPPLHSLRTAESKLAKPRRLLPQQRAAGHLHFGKQLGCPMSGVKQGQDLEIPHCGYLACCRFCKVHELFLRGILPQSTCILLLLVGSTVGMRRELVLLVKSDCRTLCETASAPPGHSGLVTTARAWMGQIANRQCLTNAINSPKPFRSSTWNECYTNEANRTT